MGVKKNFGYNLILTLCNYLFPLLTYPYVSRVLGVSNIGICNFVDSIISYFLLFSMLGVGSYGVREIARCKDDADKRNDVFSNLFAVNTILTAVSVIILISVTLIIPKLSPYKDFLGVGVLKLVFNLFLIEWFFQGIEQFKYITVRSLLVRAVYVVAIFAFVKSKSDVLIYYILTSLIIVVNAIFNWSYSRKYRKLRFNSLSIKAYFIPILAFGYYRILTSMYTTFNTLFLGFSSNNTEVGYFSTATKLYTIIMSAFTAFTTVMIPRVSKMVENNETLALKKIFNQVFDGLFAIACPIIVFCIVYAPQIIFLISGSGYEGAIVPFRIIIALLLIIGIEQVVIQQFLMALKSNKPIFIVSTVGAIVGIISNIIFTPKLGAIGSAISWTISEIAVLIIGIQIMKRHIDYSFDRKILKRTLICVLVYIIVCTLSGIVFMKWTSFIISFIVVTLTFILFYLLLYKDSLIYSLYASLKAKLLS